MNQQISFPPDEQIILKFRLHWWLFFIDIVPTVFVGILPFIFVTVLADLGQLPDWATPTIITWASAWWLLIIWCALAVQWTTNYLNLWIVTNRRIVNIHQKALFDRETTTWRLDHVQEVTVAVQSFMGTLLGFGTVEVQTAGPTDVYATIRGVRDPEQIQKTIMEEADRFTESHKTDTVTQQ